MRRGLCFFVFPWGDIVRVHVGCCSVSCTHLRLFSKRNDDRGLFALSPCNILIVFRENTGYFDVMVLSCLMVSGSQVLVVHVNVACSLDGFPSICHGLGEPFVQTPCVHIYSLGDLLQFKLYATALLTYDATRHHK